MNKTVIYLDTSIIGFFENPEPEFEKNEENYELNIRRKKTQEFIKIVKDNPDQYLLVASPLIVMEQERAPEGLKENLEQRLNEIDPFFFPKHPQVNLLHMEYRNACLLPYPKCKEDLLHIAYAVYYECDIIVSWNFKHFVNENTIRSLKKINQKLDVLTPDIISPSTFIERFKQ